MKKFAMTTLLAAIALPLTFAAQTPAPSTTDTKGTTKTEKVSKKKHNKKSKKTATPAATPAPTK
jgi:hypothetical protein